MQLFVSDLICHKTRLDGAEAAAKLQRCGYCALAGQWQSGAWANAERWQSCVSSAVAGRWRGGGGRKRGGSGATAEQWWSTVAEHWRSSGAADGAAIKQ